MDDAKGGKKKENQKRSMKFERKAVLHRLANLRNQKRHRDQDKEAQWKNVQLSVGHSRTRLSQSTET